MQEPPERTPEPQPDAPSEEHAKHPFRRWLYGSFFGTLLFIAGILGVLQWVFAKYSDPLIGTLLKEIVDLKTEGRYAVTYDHIQVNLLGRRLMVENIELRTTAKGRVQRPADFALNVPQIEVEGLSLWDIYFNEVVSLSKIDIQEPEFELFFHPYLKKNKADKATGKGLYYYIENYVDNLAIEDFHINDGYVLVHVNDSAGVQKEVPLYNINIGIRDFLVDESTHRANEPFRTSQIKIDLSDNSFSLADGKFSLLIGKFVSDSYTQQIRFDELYLVPIKTNGKKLNTSFYTPTLLLDGVDFQKLRLEQRFYAQKLYVEKPDIEFRPEKKTPSTEASKVEIDPAKLTQFLRSFEIGESVFEGSHFKLMFPQLPKPIDQRDVTLRLFHTKVDSAFLANLASDPFFFQDFEIELPDIGLDFPTKLHRTSIGKIVLSSNRSLAELHGVRTRPKVRRNYFKTTERKKTLSLYEWDIPKVSLSGLRVWEFIKWKKLRADRLQMTLLNGLLEQYPVSEGKSEMLEESQSNKRNMLSLKDFYPSLPKNLNGISIRNIQINATDFEYKQHVEDTVLSAKSGSTKFISQGFELMKEKPADFSPLLFSKDVELELKDWYAFKPDLKHQFQGEYLSYSLKKEKLRMEGFTFSPATNDSLAPDFSLPLVQLSVPVLESNGLNLPHVLTDSLLQVRSLNIVEPQLVYHQKKNEEGEIDWKEISTTSVQKAFPFKTFGIDSLRLTKASIVFADTLNATRQLWQLDSLYSSLLQFGFDSAKLAQNEWLPTWERLDFGWHNYHTVLPDSSHQVAIGNTFYDGKLQIFIADSLRLTPNTQREGIAQQTHADLLVPELRITNWQPVKFFQEKTWKADELQFNGVSLQALLPALPKNSPDSLAGNPKIVNLPFDSLQIGELSFNGRQTEFAITNSATQQFVSAEAWSVRLQEVSLKDGQAFRKATDLLPEATELYFREFKVESSTDSQKVAVHSLWASRKADSLRIEDLKLLPKTPNLWLIPEKRSGSQQVFHIDDLMLSEVGFEKILNGEPLEIGKIRVKSPQLFAQHLRGNKEETTEETEFVEGALIKKLHGILGPVKVGTFLVSNASLQSEQCHFQEITPLSVQVSQRDTSFRLLEQINPEKGCPVFPTIERLPIEGFPGWEHPVVHKKSFSVGVPEVDLEVVKLSVPEFLHDSLTLFEVTEDVRLFIHDYYRKLPDSLNAIAFKKLSISTRNSKVFLDSIRLIPLYEKYQFGKQKGAQTDRIEMFCPKIEFWEFELPELLFNQNFVANRVEIKDLDVNVFRDKTIPRDSTNVPLPMPWHALREAGVDISVDVAILARANIRYEEYTGDFQSEKRRRKKNDNMTIKNQGVITFNDLGAYILNITNRPEELRHDPNMKLFVNTDLMEDCGRLRLNFTIPITDEAGNYSYEGSADHLKLPGLNPLLEKLVFVRIEEGYSDGLNFKVHANDRYAVGNMQFKYDDLKIQVLNSKKVRDSTYKVDKFVSFLANNIIRSRNPDFWGMREGEIYYDRDTSKYLFNFWAKTMLSGIQSTLMKSKRNKPSKFLRKVVRTEQKGLQKLMKATKRKKKDKLPKEVPANATFPEIIEEPQRKEEKE